MADPASVFSIVSGAVDLVFKCAKVVTALHDLREKYKVADLSIRSIIEHVESIRTAWKRIERWLTEHGRNLDANDDDDQELMDQLDRKLECGDLVITAFVEDLQAFLDDKGHNKSSFALRTKFIWNETAIEAHRDRIRDQVMSMTLLLQTLDLATPNQRKQLIQDCKIQLDKSDESAYSIVPSRMSRSTWASSIGSRASVELTYQPLLFEDELFTSRVYKRNYRTPRAIGKLNGRASHTNSHSTDEPASETDTVRSTQLHTAARSTASTHASEITIYYQNDIASNLDDGTDSLLDPRIVQEALDRTGGFEPPVSVEIAYVSQSEPGQVSKTRRLIHSRPLNQDLLLPITGIGTKPRVRSTLALACYRGRRSAIADASSGYQLKKAMEIDGVETPNHYLRLLAKNGDVDLMKFLLQDGWHCHLDDEADHKLTPIHIAIIDDKVKMTKLLATYGANVHCISLKKSPIHRAVEASSTTIVEILLEHGASAQSVVYEPRTILKPLVRPISLLHLSMIKMRPEISKVLLRYGADPFFKSEAEPLIQSGESLVDCALRRASVEIVLQLLSLGLKPSGDVSFSGKTTMHYAAQYNRPDLMAAITNRRSDLRCKDALGREPSHTAAEWNSIAVLQLLKMIIPEALFSIDSSGLTPLSMASSSSTKQAEYFIRGYAARKHKEHIATLKRHSHEFAHNSHHLDQLVDCGNSAYR